MITKRIAKTKRRQKKESFFKHKKRLGFMTLLNTTAEESVATWNELRLFLLNWLKTKRLSDISTKATAISKKRWH
jgi:hypothetical protein